MIEAEVEVRHRKKRLTRDVLKWEECYERFRDRFDELENYERRIRTLEKELERRSMVFGVFKKERYWLLGATALFVVASYLFTAMVVIRLGEPWLFFLAGLLIGICGAALLNIWIEIQRGVV
ncbi:MAG: hypothetical protein GXO65_03140 [Euryarchaeota archaeon]|nr:hypothetical protein [Euryarchaeota archaeon]